MRVGEFLKVRLLELCNQEKVKKGKIKINGKATLLLDQVSIYFT